MRPASYHTEDLISLLRQGKIATMDDLLGALGTIADATVFRKLAGLDYRTSYSHRGRYYTLDETARFDTLGLWGFGQVWFSRSGTLVATVEALVSTAEAGYDAAELEGVLHVEAKQALLALERGGRLARQKVAGRYLYLAPKVSVAKTQLAARSVYDAEGSGLHLGTGLRVLPDELKAAIVLFYSLLDERQRRLYAGLEAMKIGHGGDTAIAELLDMDPGTVARGRAELFTGDIESNRVRRTGGGRHSAQKNSPEVIAAIGALMANDTAGDPMTGIKWTRRTTEKIAEELQACGIEVCANTVAKLLKDLDYRLGVNHKLLERASPPDRDAQFNYIAAQRETFAHAGVPIISIDAKKRELDTNFKNQGTTWRQTPILVNDHDFPSDAKGVALPYGIYDVGANHGYLFIGTTHDTSDFAVDNVVRWWNYHGKRRYVGKHELLILADRGGSNGARTRAFKLGLQERLCDRHGLTVTVCHYPTAASKWEVEHRLFSEVSKN